MILGSWFLNEIWITDLSSAPVGILMRSSKLFLFFEQNSFKLSCETVIGIVLCYSHQVCRLLCYLCEITSLLNFYTSVSGCGCNGFGEEKVRIGGCAYHYSTPLHPVDNIDRQEAYSLMVEYNVSLNC